MRTSVLLTTLFFFLFQSSLAQEQLIFQNYTLDNGLPSFYIYGVEQDHDGFIWLGTANGVTRFDGYNFKPYPNKYQDSPVDRVISMELDQEGNIWISRLFLPLEKFDPRTETSIYFPSDSNSFPNDVHIELHFQDPNTLWVGHGNGGGISQLNTLSGEIKNIPLEMGSPEKHGKEFNHIWDIHLDPEGNLWLGREYGLYRYDSTTKDFIRYTYDHLYPNPRHTPYYENIIDAGPGKLLVETKAGPLLFDIESEKFEPILDYEALVYYGNWSSSVKQGDNLWIAGARANPERGFESSRGLLNYNTITKTAIEYHVDQDIPYYLDRSGTIWVNNPGKGISTFSPAQNKIKTYDFKSIDESLKNQVTYVYPYFKNAYWIGSNSGLYLAEFVNQKWTLKQDYSQQIESEVSFIFQGSNQTIWCGTIDGLYRMRQGESRFHKIPLTDLPGVAQRMPERPYFNQAIEDPQGRVWFSGWGLLEYIPGENKYNWKFDQDSSYFSNIQQDAYGTIWVTKPFYEITAFNKTTDSFHSFEIPNNLVNYTTALDSEGTLWIGTNTGLFSLTTQPIETLLSTGVEIVNKNQLIAPWDFVANLQFHNKHLWIVLPMGIAKLNPTTNESEIFDRYDGLVKNPWDGDFKNSFITSKGRLIYSWNDRLSTFHADEIQYNTYIPPVQLTRFELFNQVINIGDSLQGKPILAKSIHHTSTITLPPGQTFSFEFATLDYTNPKENQYSFKMEGLDEEWSPRSHQRTATYTNLWEGDYVFRVKGSNNDAVWNEEGVSINVTILAPWYRSKLAYAFYGILIIIGLVLSRRSIIRREQDKAEKRQQMLELEKAKELDEAKTQFFSNISHEFRTPLTLILGPIKQMYEGTFKGDAHTVLGVVVRNSRRLLHLVNQLLDFTKLESGGTMLQASVGDLVEFMRTMFSTFESAAQQRKIAYMFQSSVSTLPAYFDGDKLEKVIINLLSNAFKFTRQGDSINLKMIKRSNGSPVDKGEGLVEIIIEDTGKGIASEKLDHVFERFFQADDSYTREQEGTGIGLALAKQLVELHHGTISVTSKKGKGTTFTIQLPLGKSHLKEEEIVVRKGYKPIENMAVEALPASSGSISNAKELNGDLPILLIVEDNEDMRLYLRETLSETYQIIEAADGLAGLDIALEHTPDLIISDVMMPGIDGHQLCHELKTDERTSHIPIVLLTARAGEEAKLEGLETGADDYITKPFSPVELRARVQNLIELRQKLRERYSKNLHLEPKEAAITPVDEQFLQRALDILEIHKSDPDFNTESYCREIGMSRSQLHRKLKALTNQSTGDFIRTFRLKYAKQLIEKDFGNMTQVAYECGFNSPSYFAECFKKQFGKLPSEFAKSKL